jgi:hypothetical protein
LGHYEKLKIIPKNVAKNETLIFPKKINFSVSIPCRFVVVAAPFDHYADHAKRFFLFFGQY